MQTSKPHCQSSGCFLFFLLDTKGWKLCSLPRHFSLLLLPPGRPSFRQFCLARPVCPFFQLHQSSPDLGPLGNTRLHHPVHCSPMPALYCCQSVCVQYGTACPIRVSSYCFSPPGLRDGIFFCHRIISSCLPYQLVKAWVLLSTAHPYSRTSFMLVLNFLPRQMTWPLSLMFPPGWWTGSWRWSPCPHC